MVYMNYAQSDRSFLDSPGSLNQATKASLDLRDFLERLLKKFPWEVKVTDFANQTYSIGGRSEHWRKLPLELVIKTEAAARDLKALRGMPFLDKYIAGDVEINGNPYLMPYIKKYANVEKPALLRMIPYAIKQRAFQSIERAQVNVKSHYDIPQQALDLYLDKVYQSYSCGMFEEPLRLEIAEMLRVGKGKEDNFDSLEKAMWRKFKDAADFIAPKEGESLFDVGCGYGGQLAVALSDHPFGKVVGWTHSSNQVSEGQKLLAAFDKNRWEIREGDYRQESRVFDHITSTGMVCHVGPRGLVPYLKFIRKRIRPGGRYLHHVIMSTYSKVPLDMQLGPAFNKKYVWPGFHWFSVGDHVRALERNGFIVERMTNLSPHYAKTTATWYERMMSQEKEMVAHAGQTTFRAWRLFLAGISGGFSAETITIYRIYCHAV